MALPKIMSFYLWKLYCVTFPKKIMPYFFIPLYCEIS